MPLFRVQRRGSMINLNLVVWDTNPYTTLDLQCIAAALAKIGGIRPRVVPHHKINHVGLLGQWLQPTLSVSLHCVFKRKWLAGTFVNGYYLPKHIEFRRLEAAGVPLPAWTLVEPRTRLDPTTWGAYVVEKPSMGYDAADVRIRKTNRVVFIKPEDYPRGHFGRLGPMLAQKFVYTGLWARSFRVTTLFGEALLCYRQTAVGRGHPLRGRWGFRRGGANILSNAYDVKVELVEDDEVIALAERAHRAAFAECPVLGFDIVRDVETGQLFVLESHPQGSWLFSSDVGRKIQAENHIDFAGQFGAFEKAAGILARVAPRLAARSMPFPLAAGAVKPTKNA
jgi:hypothetical protein